jgi:hypothetical protein
MMMPRLRPRRASCAGGKLRSKAALRLGVLSGARMRTVTALAREHANFKLKHPGGGRARRAHWHYRRNMGRRAFRLSRMGPGSLPPEFTRPPSLSTLCQHGPSLTRRLATLP